MIELGEGSGEFAGAWAGSGDDDERFGGFDIRVGAVAFVGDDGIDPYLYY